MIHKNRVLIKFYVQFTSIINCDVFVEICNSFFSEDVPDDELICLDNVEQVKKYYRTNFNINFVVLSINTAHKANRIQQY